jgi:hypothetical protein
MDPNNAFHSSHFLERVDGNRLAGGVCESECVWGLWDPVVLGGWKWKGGWKEGQKEGRKEGWREGQKEMQKEEQKKEQGLTAEQWKSISDKVEAQ